MGIICSYDAMDVTTLGLHIKIDVGYQSTMSTKEKSIFF